VGALYEIRVKGRITGALLEHFEDLGAHVQPGGTVLVGKVEDQAALHGLLDRIESVGLELIEVRKMPAEV
jgi:phosphosulfolactate synthase (CoM biosynthesis protein A)